MRHRLFLGAFWIYSALVTGWLLVGLAATLAGHYPGLHADVVTLSHADGLPRPLRALAMGIVAPTEAADEHSARAVLDYFFSAVSLGLGLLLVHLRGRHVVVRLLAVGLVGSAGAFNLSTHRALGALRAATGYDLDLWHILLLHAVAGVCYVYALLLFPDGRFAARRHRSKSGMRWAVVAAQMLVGNVALLYFAVSTGTAHAAAFVIFYGVLAPLVGIVAQRRRLRTAGTAEERQQSRVLLGTLVFSVAAATGLALLTLLLTAVQLPGFAPTSPDAALFGVFRALSVVVPLSIIVAVMRYRLWDIDRLFSRALRYGALTVFVTAGYTGCVLAVSALLGRRAESGVWAPLLATAVVAVAFQPIRERVHRAGDRLVYGRRESPAQLLAELTRRVADAPPDSELLGLVAATAGRGLRTARCRVAVQTVDGEEARCWPDGAGAPATGWDVTVPVLHMGAVVGEISVESAAGERLSATDRRVLADLGRQAGPALATLRLNADLRQRLEETSLLATTLTASSQRIVMASARERRRLERDIHDGAQQQLLALRLQLGALDDVHEAAALRALAARVELARESLRQLARGMSPPVLADDGLTAAVQAAADGHPGNVAVRSSGLRDVRFSRQVETVAYFCCLEALQNCARHAPGAPVRVELLLDDGQLVVAVSDEGPGFDPAPSTQGTGLAGIAQRLAEVGGQLHIATTAGSGTTVTARLPAHRVGITSPCDSEVGRPKRPPIGIG
ncbi:MAG: ATP-binding protein [Actinomycetota bacterium]|nr:ATP-binding protein [Actinomycetota bacterium]